MKTIEQIRERALSILEGRHDMDEVYELCRFLPTPVCEGDFSPLPINAVAIKRELYRTLRLAWHYANENDAARVGQLLHRLTSLVWVLGDGDLYDWVHGSNCVFKDRLAAISQLYNFNWKGEDSGVWFYPALGVMSGRPDYIEPVKVIVHEGEETRSHTILL